VRCISHIAFDLFFTNSDFFSAEHHDSASSVTTSYELTKIVPSLRAIYLQGLVSILRKRGEITHHGLPRWVIILDHE